MKARHEQQRTEDLEAKCCEIAGEFRKLQLKKRKEESAEMARRLLRERFEEAEAAKLPKKSAMNPNPIKKLSMKKFNRFTVA